MNGSVEAGKALQYCLDHGLTMACWRSPGGIIHLAVQHVPATSPSDLSALAEERNVFIAAPFSSLDGKVSVLRPDVVLSFGPGETSDPEVLRSSLFQGTDFSRTTAEPGLDRSSYCRLVERLKEAIRSGAAEKVVLSRTLGLALDGLSAADLFLDACTRNPDAFVCALQTPEHGLWLGASPERLLRAEDGRVEVDAIAGTLPGPIAPEDPLSWGPKERHEQDLVTRAVLDAFLTQGVEGMTIRGPEVLPAGPVLHLHTRFSGELVDDALAGLVQALHPTPAVCGTPRGAAMDLIGRLEPSPRGLYAGYWGAWRWYGRTELMVNIRCLRIHKELAVLHVGGGITAESDPDSEWEETEQKARTWQVPIGSLTIR